MKEFWFTPKNYGCGFYPSSWQGWLIILTALALICAAFYLSNPFEDKTTDQTIRDWLRFIIDFILITPLGKSSRHYRNLNRFDRFKR